MPRPKEEFYNLDIKMVCKLDLPAGSQELEIKNLIIFRFSKIIWACNAVDKCGCNKNDFVV
jgi:hypothetical protein